MPRPTRSTTFAVASSEVSKDVAGDLDNQETTMSLPRTVKRSAKALTGEAQPIKRARASRPSKTAQASLPSQESDSKPPVKGREAAEILQTPPQPTQITPQPPFSLAEARNHLSSHDPRFHNIFTHLPCKPFEPPYPAIDPFRTLVTSIVGQQVSWMAARAINKRFRELFGFGDADEEGEGGGFPTPGMVVKEDVLRLKSVGLSMRKAEYVKSLAEHFESGQLSDELLRDGSNEEVAKALIAVRGIGQWTVDMFLMFSLRRPDILPVGDLGVQKGLVRWALAAHNALPASTKAKGKASEQAREKYGMNKKKEIISDKVDASGEGEIDTLIISSERPRTPPKSTVQLPPTPFTPNDGTPSVAVLHTPDMSGPSTIPTLPPTPLSPGIKPQETLVVNPRELPPPAPEELLASMPGHPSWDANRVAPLEGGLSIELLKSRLSGKKAKGGVYLLPKEMEVLTQGWKPYRSLGVYYMWPAGEEF